MSMRVSAEKNRKNLNTARVFDYVLSIFGETMHLKRVESLANAAIGLLYAEELILHKMGAGLAQAKGLDKKSAAYGCHMLSLRIMK